MKRIALTALFALAACATQLPQVVVTGGETFDVRYDAQVQTTTEVDRVADGHCNGVPASFQSERVGFENLSYRTYRCTAPFAGPQTVSVALGSDSDAVARRECGSEVRPETVHHESNVVTYRCLRGAN